MFDDTHSTPTTQNILHVCCILYDLIFPIPPAKVVYIFQLCNTSFEKNTSLLLDGECVFMKKKRVEGRKVAVFLLKIWSFHKKIVLLPSKWLQYYNLLMQNIRL